MRVCRVCSVSNVVGGGVVVVCVCEPSYNCANANGKQRAPRRRRHASRVNGTPSHGKVPVTRHGGKVRRPAAAAQGSSLQSTVAYVMGTERGNARHNAAVIIGGSG